MDLDLPAEADMSLCSLCSENSYTWGHLFPARFDGWIERTILSQGASNDAWINDYDYFIRKLSLKGMGKRVVIKSPGDTGRVAGLLRRYPDALFIYIHREPSAVFHSSLYFWKVLQQQVSLQQLSEDEIQELIIRNYRKVVTAYLEQRRLIPSGQLAEVEYEALAEDPLGKMSEVYERLALGPLPVEIVNTLPAQRTRHNLATYTTSKELSRRLRIEWPFAFETNAMDLTKQV
jgi:hypothetical protein